MNTKVDVLDSHAVTHPFFSFQVEDICVGADPFVFSAGGKWHLLVQDDFNMEPHAHDGIRGYSIRSADTLELLKDSASVPLTVAYQPDNLRQAWAAEVHFDEYMYVSLSDGNNTNHRMHVYKTEGDVTGPWRYIGPLIVPQEDDCWAIDLTLATIKYEGENKNFAVWSGWEDIVSANTPEEALTNVVPQNIYIAEFISPLEIGHRHVLMRPEGEWCSSVMPILEGPQVVMYEEKFQGLLVTGNASWTTEYATHFLKYLGGDPLRQESWKLHDELLFRAGNGIGHGVCVHDESGLFYFGHRKSSRSQGWADRLVFSTPLEPKKFSRYIAGRRVSRGNFAKRWSSRAWLTLRRFVGR